MWRFKHLRRLSLLPFSAKNKLFISTNKLLIHFFIHFVLLLPPPITSLQATWSNNTPFQKLTFMLHYVPHSIIFQTLTFYHTDMPVESS